MATVEKLLKPAPIGGQGRFEKNIDAWAARASRNSVQFSRNDPAKNNTMHLDDTSAPAKTEVRTFDQLKMGKG